MQLVKAKECDFDQIYKIMEQSFVKQEYRSKKRQYDLFVKDFYDVRILKQENEILGFLASFKLDELNFIEHFALSYKFRNLGYGQKMLNNYLSQNKYPTVLEVETPVCETCKRRVKFYERNGFKLTSLTYDQPPLNDSDEKISLTLMSYPTKLTADDEKRIKKILFKKVYAI